MCSTWRLIYNAWNSVLMIDLLQCVGPRRGVDVSLVVPRSLQLGCTKELQTLGGTDDALNAVDYSQVRISSARSRSIISRTFYTVESS